MLARLWSRWKRFAQRVADFQARLILTLIYYLILAPFGLIVSALSDLLRTKRPQASTWVARPAEEPSLQNARKQF